jgi:voltage-gated sodium channel
MKVNRKAKISQSKTFHNLVTGTIILCALTLGLETYQTGFKGFFYLLDLAFTIFFTVEIGIRIWESDGFFSFFHLCSVKIDETLKLKFKENAFWNLFDFTIVVFSLVSLFTPLFTHPEMLVVGRLFRVFRVMRLLEINEGLRSVEKKIISIIPTIFSFILLLGILYYIYAIVGIYIFNHQKIENANFSSLNTAFVTLFQIMTLDNWSDLMYLTASKYENSWWIQGYFISFVLFTAIISFNVFIAVLTSEVQQKMTEEKELKKKGFFAGSTETQKKTEEKLSDLLEEIKALRKELMEMKGMK